MNKWFKIIAIMLLLITTVLAWCNNNNNQKNDTKNSSISKDNKNLSSSNKATLWENVTLYIDKNCEVAGFQQCNWEIRKKQLSQILRNGLKIVYMDDQEKNDMNDFIWASPIMVIPEKKLSVFWPQQESIKKSAKFKDWKYYIPLFWWIPGEENLCNDWKDNNNDWKIDENDSTCYSMTILTSNKCKEAYCNPNALKKMFMWYHVNILDYSASTWKIIYDKLLSINKTQLLPTFLFNKKQKYISKLWNMLSEISWDNLWYKYQVNISDFKYDPSIEACEKNCNASPSCKKILKCNKSDKPTVELFVMSYCPYWTQAEKWILPVIKLLKNKIDFKIKFVNYCMHWKKEIDENTLQYCIQEKEPKKYLWYLECFLWKEDNSENCKKKLWINKNIIEKCIKNASEKFNITKNFPKYDIYDKENKKYWVQGSPTLVINGIKVSPKWRSPKAYLEIICSAFKNPPKECKKELSNVPYDSWFGWTQSWKPAPAWSCGK